MNKVVLLLGAGGVQTLPVAQSLHKKGYRVLLHLHDMRNYGSRTKYAHRTIIIEDSVGSPQFLNKIISVIKEEGVDVLIPLSDLTADFISRNQNLLKDDVAFVTPAYDSFCLGYDKNKLMSVCRENGFPHPYTIDLSGLDSSTVEIERKHFPMLIKPNCTTGGRGMTIVESVEELRNKYPKIQRQYGECHLQEYIPQGGGQLKIQLYVDERQNLIAHSSIRKHRWYPENGGSCSCGESVNEMDIVNICHEVLKKIQWIGFADFDLIGDPRDGTWRIMEINPRVPACIRVSFEAGVDWAEIIVNGALGNEQKKYVHQHGVYLRHLGFEMLWFFYSDKRFKARPSWFKFIGKNVFYEDLVWNDLKPFIYGTYYNIKKQRSEEFRNSKAGTRK